jgi:iron(III) transport system permease protein
LVDAFAQATYCRLYVTAVATAEAHRRGGAEAPGRWRALAPARRRPGAIGASTILFVGATGVVGFFVLAPIALLLVNSLQVGPVGGPQAWSLDGWRQALATPKVQAAVVNTVTLGLTRQAIALVCAVVLAWLLARSDVPGRGALEFGFWVAVFLPPLTTTLAWILVFDSPGGLANRALELLPFVQHGPFNIYGWWGIVWVHLVTLSIPIQVMLLVPAFRNLDASFEEAGRSLGSSPLQTLRRVVVPLLAPAITVVALLGFIRSLESFEIEQVLGFPAGIQVYSTLIYQLAQQTPPAYGQATALAGLILVATCPLIVYQQWYAGRTSHATVSGRFSGRPLRLGWWRWPVFAAILLVLLTMTVVPMALVVMGTFMSRFGRFDAAQPWTVANWTTTFGNGQFTAALVNTLLVGLGAAVVAAVAFSLLAYLTIHARVRWKRLMDYLIWLPSALPGIILGLGYLWLFLGTPWLRPVYGTRWVLILVVALSVMTVTTQVVKSNLVQLGAELEEASLASGAAWPVTFRRIVVPLVAPSLVVVAILAFSSAARVTSYVALLSTVSNQPLSMLQLQYANSGRLESASVIGVVIMGLTVGVALASRWVGSRLAVRAELP